MSQGVLTVIPSRLAATRLPGKPLLDVQGVPMIVQCWRRAREADLGPVVVACADPPIAAAIREAGGRAVMTNRDHPSGSDRVWEAVCRVDPDARHAVVINLQGDLPTVEPQSVRAAAVAMAESGADIGTIAAPIDRAADRDNPDVVKVAACFPAEGAGRHGRALYFSRRPIPAGDGDLFHHIGVYAYGRAALRRFVRLPPGVLERREGLEQLRALEAGMHVEAARVDAVPVGVDTAADLERARRILADRP